MNEVWDFLSNPQNREVLAWIGGGALALGAFILNATKKNKQSTDTQRINIRHSGNVSGNQNRILWNFGTVRSGLGWLGGLLVTAALLIILALALSLRAHESRPLAEFNLELDCGSDANPLSLSDLESVTIAAFLDFLEQNNGEAVFVSVEIRASNGAGECFRVVSPNDARFSELLFLAAESKGSQYFGEFSYDRAVNKSTEDGLELSQEYSEAVSFLFRPLNEHNIDPAVIDDIYSASYSLGASYHRLPETLAKNSFVIHSAGGARGIDLYLPEQKFMLGRENYKVSSTPHLRLSYQGVFIARYFAATTTGGYLEPISANSALNDRAMCNKVDRRRHRVVSFIWDGCITEAPYGVLQSKP